MCAMSLRTRAKTVFTGVGTPLLATRRRDRAVEHVDFGCGFARAQIEQQRRRLRAARAGDAVRQAACARPGSAAWRRQAARAPDSAAGRSARAAAHASPRALRESSRISSAKICRSARSRFGSTLRIAQHALATTLSASFVHFSARQSSTTLTVKPVPRTSPRASCTRSRRPARTRSRRRSRGVRCRRDRDRPATVSAAATTLSAPNAAASFSSLPTPFCGETKTHFSGCAIGLRSVSIAPSVSYGFRRDDRDVGLERRRRRRARAART